MSIPTEKVAEVLARHNMLHMELQGGVILEESAVLAAVPCPLTNKLARGKVH